MTEHELPTREQVEQIRERVADYVKLTRSDELLLSRGAADYMALLALLDEAKVILTEVLHNTYSCNCSMCRRIRDIVERIGGNDGQTHCKVPR
jgi:selenocysteine lyase/cysteine desulfurase